MVADGILPSNEGRGYVLRRIARRAIRHGYKLGQKGLFFHKIVADLVAEMGEAYPELREKQAHIEDALRAEEIKFAETLEIGMGLVDSALEGGKTALDGDTIFKLYDTFGFPVDLTADICRERDIHADLEGFERAMEAQRERGRAGSSFKMTGKVSYSGADTCFHGYESASTDAKVLALFKGTEAVAALEAGEEGIVVLDDTLLRRRRRPGRRRRRDFAARRHRRAVRRQRHPEDPGRGIRPQGQAGPRPPGRRRQRDRHHRSVRARRQRPQPLRHPPLARGAAPRAGRPCRAEGLAGESGAHPLRLRPRRTGQRRTDRRAGARGQPRDQPQSAGQGRSDEHGSRAEIRRDDAVRRKIRR